jgi:Zn-finger protein
VLSVWLAVFVAAFSFAAAEAAEQASQRLSGEVLQMCTGTYAICDAAACTPLAAQEGPPGSKSVQPTTAVCTCGVVNGPNLGPGPCANRTPTGPNGEYIMSTYSYALKNPYLTCPQGNARTVCFGYPCVIDKKDPSRAHCTCPITYDSAEFKTQGGGCNVASCSNGLWQGGTPNEYKLINEMFTKATGEQPPPDCAAIVK